MPLTQVFANLFAAAFLTTKDGSPSSVQDGRVGAAWAAPWPVPASRQAACGAGTGALGDLQGEEPEAGWIL